MKIHAPLAAAAATLLRKAIPAKEGLLRFHSDLRIGQEEGFL